MPSTVDYAGAILALILFYISYLSLYRLVLSPISHFPGPKLAALTFWYEFYYDVIQRGQYEFKIAQLHREYGPIVRINPYELHIAEPDYHDILYFGSNANEKIDKWHWQGKQFGFPQSSFGTVDHNVHRMRRAAVAPLFSTRAIASLEPYIQECVDQLKERLLALKGTGAVVNMVDVFSCLTGDVISEYCFGRPNGFLQTPDFSPQWHDLIRDYGELGHLLKQFGWLLPLMDSLPTRVAEFLNPPLAELTKLIRLIQSQIDKVHKQRKAGSSDDNNAPVHRTVFDHILDSDELPGEEKNMTRLEHEGRVLMVAGTATTADTLSLIFFKLMQNRSILDHLRQELTAAVKSSRSGTLKLRELEQLPYLTAVIKEGLRVAHGVVQRNPRVRPDAELVFQDWIIPRNTPVSMSTWNTHVNGDVFPDPRSYKPERWLLDDLTTLTKTHDKYLVAFGRGTRVCVGRNLAYAEMYMILGALFSPSNASQGDSGSNGFEFKLFETTEDDVLFVRDCFIPSVKDGSKGVRATIQ